MKVDFFVFSEREPLALEELGVGKIKNVGANYGRESTSRLNITHCAPLYFTPENVSSSRSCETLQSM